MPQLALEFAGQGIEAARRRQPLPQPLHQKQAAQGESQAHKQQQQDLQHGAQEACCEGRQEVRSGPERDPGRHAGARFGVPMAPDDPLPALSLAELETLLAALDPRLDGFGEGESCLDDALAYLARLGIAAPTQPENQPEPGPEPPGLIRWVESWRAAGGNRRTLRLVVATLLSHSLHAADG